MKRSNLIKELLVSPLSSDNICSRLNVLIRKLRIVILKPEYKKVKLIPVNGTEKSFCSSIAKSSYGN